MAAQTGLAGSTRIGKHCRFGGQVGLAGHLTVGDNVQIGAQSGVVKDVKSDETLLASPAIDYKQALRMYSIMKNLPQLRQELIDLQKEIRKINETILKKTE
jgi:UDP-3-O-[3-hydroxymyristoyl] glucosamine N-acyltransferase